MSTNTPVFGLFAYDPEADGNLPFNITQALNNNWDKIDSLVLPSAAAAAPYNPSGTYNVGDYCIYNGTLQKCNTPIPSGEAWNAEHWTETTVAAELAGKANATPPEVLDLTLADGWSGTAKLFKTQENVCVLSISPFASKDVFTPFEQITMLPVGYTPLFTQSFPVVVFYDGFFAFTARLETDGVVRIEDAGKLPVQGGNLYLNIVYLAKEGT